MSRLLEIMDKNFPKFDVTMKIMFAVKNSYLREMLEIPLGHDLPLGFSDFEQTEVDALVRRKGAIYHVEFQSWNDPKMEYRMFDYRNSIYRHYSRRGKRTVKPDVVQTVVYIGSPNMRMEKGLKGTNLDYSYYLHDIRSFWSDWRQRLINSTLPLNWILGLVCSDDRAEDKWRPIVQGVRDHLGKNGKQAHLALPAVLLVAATLRNMSESFRREIVNMFTMSVENDPIFREIYEQGNDRATRRLLLRIIGIGLEARKVALDEKQSEELASWKVEALNELADAMAGMDLSVAELRSWLPKPEPVQEKDSDAPGW